MEASAWWCTCLSLSLYKTLYSLFVVVTKRKIMFLYKNKKKNKKKIE